MLRLGQAHSLLLILPHILQTSETHGFPYVTHSKQWPCHVTLTSGMSHYLVLALFIFPFDATLPLGHTPALPDTRSPLNMYSLLHSRLPKGKADHVILLPISSLLPQIGSHTIIPSHFYLIPSFLNLSQFLSASTPLSSYVELALIHRKPHSMLRLWVFDTSFPLDVLSIKVCFRCFLLGVKPSLIPTCPPFLSKLWSYH